MSKYKLSDYIDIFINENEDNIHKAFGSETGEIPITRLEEKLSREDVKKIKSEVVKKNPKIKYFILMTLFGYATFPLLAYISALNETNDLDNIGEDPVITAPYIEKTKIIASDEAKMKDFRKSLEAVKKDAGRVVEYNKNKRLNLNKFKKHVMDIEKLRLTPYQDAGVHISVGYGTLIERDTNIKDLSSDWILKYYEKVGLSEEESASRKEDNAEKFKQNKINLLEDLQSNLKEKTKKLLIAKKHKENYRKKTRKISKRFKKL